MTREAGLRGGTGMRVVLAVVAAVVAWCAFAASGAFATKYVDNYFGNPDGASGTIGGLFNQAGGVAVNDLTGAVYVVDRENNRVQQFDDSNEFVRAWGQDVIVDGAPNANGTGFEVCDTTAGNGPADCKEGTSSDATGGAMSTPRGVAVNQTTGHVYVTDGGHRRVQEFTADGGFVRAWGGDVVVPGGTGETFLPGGLNERQTVAIGSFFGLIGGTFALTFDGQTTGAIAYDAPAAAVDSALEALSSVGVGGVEVSGPNGGPWTVDFTGPLGGTNVPELIIDPSGLIDGLCGPGGCMDVAVATPVAGGPSGAYEICSVQSECQAGAANASFGGAFGPPFVGYPAVVPAGAPNAGNVLVADPANSRVQEFTSAGAFVRAFGFDVDGASAGTGFEICTTVNDCKSGAPGSASGQFAANEPRRLAVAPSGDVYAVEMVANLRVQKFTGTGLTASHFADDVLAGGNPSPSATESPTDIAVDPGTGRVLVAKAASSCPFPLPAAEVRIHEFSPAGALQDTHLTCSGVAFGSFTGAGLAASTGKIYTSVAGSTDPDVGIRPANGVFVLDVDGITPAIATLNPATDVTAASAALSGTVNPNSVDNAFEPTRWKLQVSRNGLDWSAAASGSFSVGTTPQPVSGVVGGLRPNTLYRTRIVTNKPFGNPDIVSPELTFLTDAVAPEVRTTATQSVGETSAVLSARVNPHSTPTTYRFEWGQGNFDHVVPVPSGSVGSGPDFVTVSQQLDGLTPATTYQYRAIAVSATEGITTGPTKTFTTTTQASAATDRGYELVSPADKVGGQGVGSWYQGYGNHNTAGVPAIEGDRFASQSYRGGVLIDGAISYGGDWTLADRTSSGWVNKPAFNRQAGYGSEAYRVPILAGGFTDDLQLTSWTSQGTIGLKMFPEQETAFANQTAFYGGTLRDWSTGKWEFFGPATAEQNSTATGAWGGTDLAADGGYAVMAPKSRGLAGAGDPTSASWPDSELVCVTGPLGGPANDCNRSVYIDDVRVGLSDTFPGAGVVSLVNVCTGSGAERTVIPSVDGSGLVEPAECPAPLAGRDSRLVSPLGATFPKDQANAVSADGSRVFFLSPDPLTGEGPGTVPAACSGSGVATACPPQLYVRQRNADASVTTRWVSRSEIAGQQASLMKAVTFEGATADGDKVLFTTASPLTADDPNGGAPVPGGVVTGSANPNSVDLYMYDFPDGAGADPGAGILTRVSRGPTGDADVNASSLRFVSSDRVYFVTAAPLPDVPAPGNGTITSAGGSVSQTQAKNLYVFDSDAPAASRWRFVAQVPATTPLGGCATTGRNYGIEGLGNQGGGAAGSDATSGSNCLDGMPDGSFVTLFTDGRLTADDPDASSGDIYGYDAETDELARLTASQEGGVGGSYTCITVGIGVGTQCHGDGGIGGDGPMLGVITDPVVAGDRTVFFESRNRLLPDDHNDVYDVYQWRNGDLSLVSAGDADADDTLYRGNDRTGKNVYLTTRDRLTWQDHDSVLDVYVARVGGGGFIEPAPPTVCAVLVDGCQGGGAPPVDVDAKTPFVAPDGNASLGDRASLSLGKVSAGQRRAAASSGVLVLRVRASGPGGVRALARARIAGRSVKVAQADKKLDRAGTVTLRLRLNAKARRVLGRGKALRLSVQVSQPGARGRTAAVLLKRGDRS